jgi:hypothetical protein
MKSNPNGDAVTWRWPCTHWPQNGDGASTHEIDGGSIDLEVNFEILVISIDSLIQ